jgi:D-alanyl-D-alanine carboxypeptidase
MGFPQSIDGTELSSNNGRADSLSATVAMRFNGLAIDQFKGGDIQETINIINSNGEYGR